MSQGLFEAQLNEVELILRRLRLLKERNRFPSYNNVAIDEFRRLDYASVWSKCYKEQLYDFVLVDFALIQFRYGAARTGVSFNYYETPFEALSYQDYLVNEIGFQPEELDEIGDSLRDDYEQALHDGDFKRAFTPVRYDYAPEDYTEGRHPAAHVHFGFGSNIRVCTVKLLRPLSFFLFVLRQHYPDQWVEFSNHADSAILVRQVREALDDVDEGFFQERDHWEMKLH